MKLYYFNNLIYKGNINRDFFLHCCHYKKSLYKYALIHFIYYFFSLFSNKFELLYKKDYHKYLNKLNNIENIIETFKIKNNKKINEWYIEKYNKNNTIIAACPIFLAKTFLKEEKIIAYELNSKNEINIKKFIESSLKLKKHYTEIYYTKFKDAGLFKSKYKYIYKSGNFLLYNHKLYNFIKIIGKILLILTLAYILLLISFTFTTVYLDEIMIKSYLNDSLLIKVNIIPIILTILVLLFVTKKLWISFGLSSLIIFIIGIINKTKLYYRDDVLKFEDLSLAKEAAIMTSRYSIIIRWYTVVCIIFCVILMLLLKKYIKKINIRYRSCFIITIVLIFLSAYEYNTVLTDKEIYEQIGNKNLINIWIGTRQSQIRGLIYPFIYSSTDLKLEPPKNYNKKEAEKILNKYTYDNIPEDKKVNFINIMLEAYNDFSKFEEITFIDNVYDKYNNIKNKSISGEIIVDIFGGGTINTERKFITGYYNLPTFRNVTNSYASYFKEQGYITESMHPIFGAFYNRNTVNLNIGFDNYWNYENKFSKISSTALEDNIFFDYIIDGLVNANKNNKYYYNFSVTYQNHGPYSTSNVSKSYIENKNYSPSAYNMFNRYLNGIEKTNEALEKIVTFLNNYEEPTVLVVFGDHNPYLGEANYVYTELGIDMTLNSVDSFLNYYGIPYFIYANDAAKIKLGKDFKGKGNMVSPNFLMNEIFEYIGYGGNEYLKYTSDVKKEISVIHPIYYKENNNYLLYDNLINKNLINEFYTINYYYATNKSKR